MRRALVTGSGGLIGSACVRRFTSAGWQVTGIDNDFRAWLFGPEASTGAVVRELVATQPGYDHRGLDLRSRAEVAALIRDLRPGVIVHTAAQPSHDRAASIPFEDFEVNAVGTLNLLEGARRWAPEAPFCFTSTNKVYGDRPNHVPRVETETRFDYADGRDGIDETMPIDQSLHSLFGASKLAADVMCQEYGRYFGMPIGVFRGGCLTGPRQAGVALHGYLSYIVRCATRGEPYTVIGYRGKQVRDQIHADDVADLFLQFSSAPRSGEVYNLGGGRPNSISVLETITALEQRGLSLRWSYVDTPRRGDHICYLSDLTKLRSHFPGWTLQHPLGQILDEMVAYHRHQTDAAQAA